MVRNEGSNLNFWWPLTSIINVSYNLKVRPCSNTPDTRLPSYCFSSFVFVQHGSSFCLSKHAGACAAALNNLPTSTLPRSLEGGGARPFAPLIRGQPAWPLQNHYTEKTARESQTWPESCSASLGPCMHVTSCHACHQRMNTDSTCESHADEADIERRGW